MEANNTRNALENIIGISGFQMYEEQTGDTYCDWQQFTVQEADWRQQLGLTKVNSRRDKLETMTGTDESSMQMEQAVDNCWD